MRKHILSIIVLVLCLSASVMPSRAQDGWPKNYGGVILQGFAWDDYDDIHWASFESQANELSQYFSLLWVPNTGNIGSLGNNMGYYPIYRYNQNTCFGTEQQLKSMISTLKQKGVGVLLDAVLNHQNGVSGWLGFASEVNPHDGQTYQLLVSDICNNDEVNTNPEAGSEYGKATGAPDTGENDWGCRDLDHTSANVQAYCTAYLKYAREYLGFTGFRYDMVKGYDGKYVGQYNQAVFGSDQIYSVGEYWDNVSAIGTWMTAAGKKSAAFDFPLKYVLNDCCNQQGYYGDVLKGISSSKALFRSTLNKHLSITFCENHDTEPVRNNDSKLTKDILAANAYIMGVPGTPCIFLLHWKNHKNAIKQLILARKAAGITNSGSYTEKSATTGKNGIYAWESGNLHAVLGGCADYATPAGYTLVIDGAADHYRYYLKNTTEMAWSTLPSCSFENPTSVQLIAVSADPAAKIVYTLDGSEPTASSAAVVSGTSINLDKSVTLKYGLLKDGVVSAIETRDYVYTPFTAHDVNVYFRNADWKQVYFHSWDSFNVLSDSWPGKNITAQTKTITDNDGQSSVFYYRTYNIPTSAYSFGLVVNNAAGVQTVDVTGINSDRYFELGDMVDGKYTIKDITSQYVTTAISPIINTPDTPANDDSWYTLNGMRVSRPATKGIYLRNGKKYVVK